MKVDIRYVDLDHAEPDEAVVVIDVLRAFTVQPWVFAQGAQRILTVTDEQEAFALRDEHFPDAFLIGEQGGAPIEGYDLGNSPSGVAARNLEGATVIHRTSAGTQGLARTIGSGLSLAASFVTATATARALRDRQPSRVTFVITGASLGRDGDEDFAAAELIAAMIRNEDPDPAPYLARIAPSTAGRMFADDGPAWAPPQDMKMASDVDRFDHALVATAAEGLTAVEVRRS